MRFDERVYAAISRIPAGKVSTYKHVAHALGTTAYRAIGQALRRNPDAPRVPCHRVVSSDGSIGGYSGERSGPKVDKKIALLRKEGVRISGGKVDPADIIELT